ncbi:hypothetical protein WJX81_002846 [Elliptochloris bilobata]|uniref:Uncharacterized protein n=1 Tax=Elliptochloris bilobata TaxID=381761 RepID=A0AAW1QY73_9CHLO
MDADHVSGHKRKAGPEELARTSSNRFKIVSQLVIAMKRFQGALNPTYTYGKRAASSAGSGKVRAKGASADSEEATSGVPPQRPASEADYVSSPEACLAFPRRGHRSEYLIAPLPPLPGERRPAALQ